MKIGIISGSIRKERKSTDVANWVMTLCQGRDAEFEVVELADFNIPLLTSATVPGAANRQYDSPEVTAWSKKIDELDAFIFVTPEYNHGVPGAFKNAVDSIAPEWMGKAVAFVSYGANQGIRAVEQWRQIIANFQMVDVRAQVALSIFRDFEENREVKSTPLLEQGVATLLDQLLAMVAKLS